MQDKLDVLNTLFDGLKFKEATYIEKTNTCLVCFLYNPDIFALSDEHKKEINDKLITIIGDFVKYELNFISCPLDKRVIANQVYSTIVNEFPTLSNNFTFNDVVIDIDKLNVKVTLKLSHSSYEHATSFDRADMVADKLKGNFLADFTVEFEEKATLEDKCDYIEKNMELVESVKEAEEKTVYELSEVVNIIGKNEYTLATDFGKIKSPVENVEICGEVISNQKKTYKKEFTKNGETKEIEKIFYSFAIKNDGKVLYCSIFPKMADENKGDLIEVGMHVCCFGSFREYKGKLNFTADSIARCEYKREDVKAGFKKLNDYYHTVIPQDYIDYEQSDMFDEQKTFEGNYVVFDLETTGLDSVKDEITEFGACKIENGVITQVFSTFVHPSKHIPREVTDLTGITDDMVKDAPSINYVLPDFYKFCYGSTLVGHNVAFDMGFIYAAARKLNYNFDNPLKDTMEMARVKLPGLKNYKLGTVVERLNVKLENAHRAVNDATATAKVFIKLM